MYFWVIGKEEHLLLGGAEFSVVQPVREEMDGDAGVLIFLKGAQYEIRVESSMAMNDAATLQMLANAIREVVCQMLAHPDAPLSQIGIVAPEEQEALVELGAGRRHEIDATMTFATAFEQTARRMPDRLAVADGSDSLSYGELSHRSDVLAHRTHPVRRLPEDRGEGDGEAIACGKPTIS